MCLSMWRTGGPWGPGGLGLAAWCLAGSKRNPKASHGEIPLLVGPCDFWLSTLFFGPINNTAHTTRRREPESILGRGWYKKLNEMAPGLQKIRMGHPWQRWHTDLGSEKSEDRRAKVKEHAVLRLYGQHQLPGHLFVAEVPPCQFRRPSPMSHGHLTTPKQALAVP